MLEEDFDDGRVGTLTCLPGQDGECSWVSQGARLSSADRRPRAGSCDQMGSHRTRSLVNSPDLDLLCKTAGKSPNFARLEFFYLYEAVCQAPYLLNVFLKIKLVHF